MKRQSIETVSYPKTLLLGIYAPYNRTTDVDSYFEEFFNLAKTNKVDHKVELCIKVRDIDPAYFLTKGKREELLKLCDENKVEQVIVSEPLTAIQSRNLARYLHCDIFDRTELILEIFEKAAHTAEGKMQVEIAMLQHKKSRLAGKGIHFGQQSGAIGVRGGAGETAKEKETRHIEQSILYLKRQLEKMHKSRVTQRKSRLVNKVPSICMAGYTNAGKSTLVNALTNSKVLAEDKLFATVDTTTRELYINGVKKGVISDTVGFIQQLPTKLIEAFKSTLSELHHADLLLHVIDISDPNFESHIQVVNDIFKELEISTPVLHVFNKGDKVKNSLDLSNVLAKYQPYVVVCALSKETAAPLIEYIENWQP